MLEPDGDSDGAARDVAELPLIVGSGLTVSWHGRTYSLTSEGRYCFVAGSDMRNVLVFEEDYLSLFFALSQIHVKGDRHVPLSIEERIEVAKCGRLSVMCGGITSITLKFLGGLGHRARRLVMLNPESGTTHVLFEYFAQDLQDWILVDVHNHALPESGGRLIGVRDLLCALDAGQPIHIRRLSVMGSLDYFSWKQRDTNEFGLGSELTIYSDRHAASLFCSPDRLWGVYTNDTDCYFPVDSREMAERVCGLKDCYRCLPARDWEARFYGNDET